MKIFVHCSSSSQIIDSDNFKVVLRKYIPWKFRNSLLASHYSEALLDVYRTIEKNYEQNANKERCVK